MSDETPAPSASVTNIAKPGNLGTSPFAAPGTPLTSFSASTAKSPFAVDDAIATPTLHPSVQHSPFFSEVEGAIKHVGEEVKVEFEKAIDDIEPEADDTK